jgi:hypothetical protein
MLREIKRAKAAKEKHSGRHGGGGGLSLLLDGLQFRCFGSFRAKARWSKKARPPDHGTVFSWKVAVSERVGSVVARTVNCFGPKVSRP